MNLKTFLTTQIITFFTTLCLAGEKIKVVITVDNEPREFFLHIPTSYTATNRVPLVFMLHGTGGDGEKMYENSGWAELAEQEGFIAVFPSSMRYKIIDVGVNKNITKWNHTPDAEWTFQAGEEGKDDIKFLKRVIVEVVTKYKIDIKRIYLNGFSNGGSMAAKCAVDMSDILAAVAASAGSFLLDTTYIPLRKIPVLYQIGNEDYGPGNVGPAVPMMFFDSLISTPGITFKGGKFYRTANNYTNNFGYKKEHTITGDTNFASIATYLPLEQNSNRRFLYILVKGLAHSYPNWASREHWKWMSKFTNEDINTTAKDISQTLSFNIYPNPSSDFITLSEEGSWQINDLNGRIVQQGKGAIIDVTKLQKGVYFVRMDGRVVRFMKY